MKYKLVKTLPYFDVEITVKEIITIFKDKNMFDKSKMIVEHYYDGPHDENPSIRLLYLLDDTKKEEEK